MTQQGFSIHTAILSTRKAKTYQEQFADIAIQFASLLVYHGSCNNFIIIRCFLCQSCRFSVYLTWLIQNKISTTSVFRCSHLPYQKKLITQLPITIRSTAPPRLQRLTGLPTPLLLPTSLQPKICYRCLLQRARVFFSKNRSLHLFTVKRRVNDLPKTGRFLCSINVVRATSQ